jgi:hypothetical protein
MAKSAWVKRDCCKLKCLRLPSGKKKPVYGEGVMAVGDAGNMKKHRAALRGGFPTCDDQRLCARRRPRRKRWLQRTHEVNSSSATGLCGREIRLGFAIMEALRKQVFSTPKYLATVEV